MCTVQLYIWSEMWSPPFQREYPERVSWAHFLDHCFRIHLWEIFYFLFHSFCFASWLYYLVCSGFLPMLTPGFFICVKFCINNFLFIKFIISIIILNYRNKFLSLIQQNKATVNEIENNSENFIFIHQMCKNMEKWTY